MRIRKAYKSADKSIVMQICFEIDEITRRVSVFYDKFKSLWFCENKPFGFEIHDARLGGLIMRLNSCKERLKAYADGKIEKIDELEEEIIPYRENPTLYFNIYRRLISVSDI